MNKGVIVAIIIVIAVGIGVVSFSQMNQNETDQVTSTETDQVTSTEIVENEPQSFIVGLDEDMGITEP